MKRYDERILSSLLDRYERSLLYTGKNKVNRRVSLPINKTTLPEYFDESALQYDVIHQQLEKLEADGYVRLHWKNNKKGHILEKCELDLDHIEDAYKLLHRKPKSTKEQDILNIGSAYKGKAKELDNFLDWLQKRILETKSIQKYVDMDAPRDFESLCRLVLGILSNDNECFLREFSIKHFHDSKLAEREIAKATSIISEFSDDRFKGLETEEILAEYNIYRNPSWLMMKGNVKVEIQGKSSPKQIDLSYFHGGLGISNQDIEHIEWPLDSPIEQVVTIENLTSFHKWRVEKDRATLCVYLGGYHNHVKRMFLKKLYEAWPNAKYCHFGDIDCGGFRIWKDLCTKTGIPFKTLCMDLKTYNQYFTWGRKLTEQDKRTLQTMKDDPFFNEQRELFVRMLEVGMKLEQECVEGEIE